VEVTLVLATCHVILDIFLVLRNLSATIIPSLALPISVIGTFGAMAMFGFSLNNLSLLALTLAVGYVVDDAIVMLENIVRHMEQGKKPMEAALIGSREIAFTIVSMTVSLVAVFIPVMFMGGLVGRLLHEFAVTIAAAIIVSGIVSVTLTPMMCSRARRLNLGLFQKDINVAWDLAPHDISIILYVMDEAPISVNCNGSTHVTPKIEDVTTMCLSFKNNRSAIIHSSWIDPRKVREMTIVGSRRMVVYDDVAQNDKIKVFDARVETPPHYDTFADFHYAYHYGDVYVPYIKQEEPLKVECQHFLDCISRRATPISGGEQGLELVKILEASSQSLKQKGAAVDLRGASRFASSKNGQFTPEVSPAKVAKPARRSNKRAV
jgi:hypothetical protein